MFDHNIRDFPSPVSRSSEPTVEPPEPAVSMMASHDGEPGQDFAIVIKAMERDPLFAAAVVALAAKTEKQRKQAVEASEFWLNDLTPQDRVKVVESFRSDLSTAEVARLSGTSERSLFRWRKRCGRRPAARPKRVRGIKAQTGYFEAWDDSTDGTTDWQS